MTRKPTTHSRKKKTAGAKSAKPAQRRSKSSRHSHQEDGRYEARTRGQGRDDRYDIDRGGYEMQESGGRRRDNDYNEQDERRPQSREDMRTRIKGVLS